MANFEDGVKKKLLRGTEQLMSCQSEGSGRTIITDGYSAIDNFLSAFLLQHKKVNPENHKKKLADAMDLIGKDFQKFKFSRKDLLEYYESWKKSRYGLEAISPGQAYKFKIIAVFFCEYLTGQIALMANIDKEFLKEELYVELQGARWLKYEDVISRIHEEIQCQAEEAAENGIGSRLGNKLINPSNFSHLSLASDDEITKKIINESEEIHVEIASIYRSFMKIIAVARLERVRKGVDDNEINNFSLSLRTRFLGETKEETVSWFNDIMENAIKDVKNRFSE